MKRALPWLMCALLAACGGGDGTERQQPQGGQPGAGAAYTVQLSGGAPQVLAQESLTLTLTNVADSRCPAQAQ